MHYPQALGYYVNNLKGSIPKEALKPATYKLIPMFAHALFIFSLIWLIHWSEKSVVLIFICSIAIGISIACLFLYSHELSHKTIVKNKSLLYVLENFFWAFSGIPPTVWFKVHNLSHHLHMNTTHDPDRKTFKSEKNVFNYIYNSFIYPNKRLRYSITVGFAMIFYSIKHTLAVFYSKKHKPSIVTYRPEYSPQEQIQVFFELVYIIVFWLATCLFIGGYAGLVVISLAWITYSSFVILFIITQHLRNPVFKDIADPLLTTTSVIIPTWLDKLIDWHSFHVEHHLYPGINFDYYKNLSPIIKENFPERYNRISLWTAIKESYNQDIFMDDPLL